MRVAIIGCGGIGMRRGAAVEAVEGASITIGVDVVEENARKFGERFGCEYGTDWEAAVDSDDADLVVAAGAPGARGPGSSGGAWEDDGGVRRAFRLRARGGREGGGRPR